MLFCVRFAYKIAYKIYMIPSVKFTQLQYSIFKNQLMYVQAHIWRFKRLLNSDRQDIENAIKMRIRLKYELSEALCAI